jgi:multiple sugar transport system substrate-binding protein
MGVSLFDGSTEAAHGSFLACRGSQQKAREVTMKVTKFTVLLLILISTGVAYGAGPQEEEAIADTLYSKYAGATIKLMRHPGFDADWMRSKIERFQEIAGVTVIQDEIGTAKLETKQILLLAAKDSGYDLYGVGAWSSKLAEAGWVENLAPYLENPAFPSVDLDDFWPAGRDHFNWKGVQYGLPWKVNLGAVLYYRKDIFEKFGLTAPETWDQWLAAVEKLEGADAIPLGVSMEAGQTFNTFQFLTDRNGGITFDGNKPMLNSPENVETMEFMVELKANMPDDVVSWDLVDVINQFMQERLAMIANVISISGWVEDPERSAIVGKSDLAPLPYNRVKGMGPPYTWGLLLNPYGKNKEIAYLYMQYLLSEESGRSLPDYVRSLPGRKSVWNDPSVRAAHPVLTRFYGLYRDTVRTTGQPYLVPNFPEFSEVSDAVSAEIQKALFGLKTPQQAMDTAQAKAEALIGVGM